MTAPSHTSCSHSAADIAVSVRDLRVTLGGQAVLRGVNLHLHRGQLVALIGPNGSGKTTLLRAIVGLQKPDSGDVRLVGEANKQRARPRGGYVPQRLALDRSFILSVREFLALRLRETQHWFWHRKRDTDERLRAGMAELGVEALLDRPIAGLSGGQLQRVLIVFALLRNPDLLLLDEPTAGVDSPGEQTFYDLIGEVHRRHKLTVVLVSHDLSMVYRHASWVYALNGVVCCEGSPEHVMNADSLKEAYGLNVTPYHHHGHSHGPGQGTCQ
ncbi:MAG: metal ABC transporter ATP-binding protein [Limisphaerales bacterium]